MDANPLRPEPDDHGRFPSLPDCLDPSEEIDLARKSKEGDVALNELENMAMQVIEKAVEVANPGPSSLAELIPLIKQPLRRAIERYALDGTVEGGLAGYSIEAIRQAVSRFTKSRACKSGERCFEDSLLAKRWADGLQIAEISRLESEEHRLRLIRERVAAQRRLAECNVRLAIHCASNYWKAWKPKGYRVEDLAARAYLALVRAARGYDGRARFSTYAYPIMWRELERPDGDFARCPANQVRKMARYSREEDRLRKELNRRPQRHEVYRALNWSRTQQKNYEKAVQAEHTRSLERDVASEAKQIEDESAPDPVWGDGEEACRAAIRQLPFPQRQVVCMHLAGLKIPEIAKVLGRPPNEIKRRFREAYELVARDLLRE